MAQQLRQAGTTAAEAASRYGIDAGSLIAINDKVFEGTLNGHVYVIKCIDERMGRVEEYYGEAEFRHHLKSLGVYVAEPLRSQNDKYVEPIRRSSAANTYVTVYEKLQGNGWEGELTAERIGLFGQAVGRMHKAAKSYKPSVPEWKRVEWHESRFLDFAALLPGSASRLLDVCESFLSRVRSIPLTADSYGLIHGNLHQHNVIQGDSEVALIDFEEAEYNWFAADIAELVYNQSFHFDVPNNREARSAFANSFLSHFLRGYLKEHPVDPASFAYFHDFLRVRDLFLLGFSTTFYYDEKRFERYLTKMTGEWNLLDIDERKLTAFVAEEIRSMRN